MKAPNALIIFLLAVLTGGASGQGVRSLPTPDKDPFVGTWKANRYKSRPKLNDEDASYVRTIAREGDELVFSSQMDSRIHSGKLNENHYRIRCDGSPHPVPFGSISCDYKKASLIEGETLSLTNEKSFWAREVSTDGQEQTILEYKDKARTKLRRTWVLDRVN
jgi:hypothetical protein